MRRRLLAITALCAASALVAPNGALAVNGGFRARLRLTSSRPSTPSGVILNLVRPNDPNGKPKTEAVGVFKLPTGTRVNLNAVPPCTKDDITWQVEGPGTCPDSFIGTGFVTLYSGLGPPVDPMGIDEQWFYAPRQIVALYTLHGTRSPVLSLGRVQIRGSTFTARLNLPPGYPPGSKMSPKETDVTINRYLGPRGPFLTTPRTCPASKRWITRVKLYYDNGTTDTVSDATPCRRLKSGRQRPGSRRLRER